MQNILDVKNLSVNFGGIKALQNITFEVPKESITAIIGPNGAGKTTVFNCLTGFYRASGGTLTFHDDNKSHTLGELLGEKLRFSDVLNLPKLPRKLYYKFFGGSFRIAEIGVARTFQNIRLFKQMSVLENLLVAQHKLVNRNLMSGILLTPGYRAAEKKALGRALYWLDLVGLRAEANRTAGELPYGHQRRLEIARAMCTDAKLLCLDEPAAGLNHEETWLLAQLILKLRKEHKITVLVIEHDMALVMNISDKIVVLDHGEVIASGKPAEIQKNKKVLAAYLGEEA
jgi:branched-chain amino acid transport system ATP-binding protein